MCLLSSPKDADGNTYTASRTRAGSVKLSGSVHVVGLLVDFPYTLLFFRRQRLHALRTLLRTLLSECECSEAGVDWRLAIMRNVDGLAKGWRYG